MYFLKMHYFRILQFFICLTGLLQVPLFSQSPDTASIPPDIAEPVEDSITIADSVTTEFAADTADTAEQESPRDSVAYDAKQIEYDIGTKVLLLTGEGIVRYDNLVLYADTIHYALTENILVATGEPMLIDGADTVVGESMVYNLVTRRGRVRKATAASGESRYDGTFIAKSDSNTYFIEHGLFTSCAVVDSPHYAFYGRRVKVTPGDKAYTRPVVLNIGGSPVASLPYFILPLDRSRHSGWLRPEWRGRQGLQSGSLDNVGYYWAPNEYMDYTTYGKIDDFVTYELNAISRYRLKYWMNGSIGGSYTASTAQASLSNQWSLDYNHYQNLLPDNSLRLSGNGRLVSSSTYYTDFSEDTTDLISRTLSSGLELSKTFRKTNTSLNASWRRNHNLETSFIDETLPSVSFVVPSRSLIPYENNGGDDDEPAWYNNIRYGYRLQGLRKRRFYTDEADTNVADFDHAGADQSLNVSYNQKVFEYLTLSPNFSVSSSLFDQYVIPGSIPVDTTITIFDTLQSGELLGRTPVDTIYIIDQLTDDTIGTEFVVADERDSSFLGNDTINRWNLTTPSWRAGVSLSTNIYGLFPISIAALDGVRHTISPSLSYSFAPEVNTNRTYPSFGIGAPSQRDRSQSVSLSIGNNFEAKTISKPGDPTEEPEEKKYNVLNGPNIGLSYNFEGAERKWSDISVGASTTLLFLNVNMSSSFRPYDAQDDFDYTPSLLRYSLTFSPRSLGASGALWGGDLLVLNDVHPKNHPWYQNAGQQQWNISLQPRYTFSQSRTEVGENFTTSKQYQLLTSVSIRPTRIWEISWGGRYDFNTNQFVGNTINTYADLECWEMKFDWTPMGVNPGFYFTVGIKKFPDIKWEERGQGRP